MVCDLDTVSVLQETTSKTNISTEKKDLFPKRYYNTYICKLANSQ